MLVGRVAIVTGAVGGNGRSAALCPASAGTNGVLVDLEPVAFAPLTAGRAPDAGYVTAQRSFSDDGWLARGGP
jgi:hypothetical protein